MGKVYQCITEPSYSGQVAEINKLGGRAITSAETQIVHLEYGFEFLRYIVRRGKTPLGLLEQAGWAESRWESDDARDLGRPRRRFYEVTGIGASRARTALQEMKVFALGALAWR